MSNYPIWWDTTVTLYNKYEDAQTNIITWYRTVLRGCFWKFTGDKITVGSVELDSKSIVCRIPEDARFMEKYQWVTIPNDQMAQYFTLGHGDIIVKGEVTDVIDEYTSGKRSSDLLAKYKLQGCMTVSDFAISVGSGRNNPHYFARGL